MHDKTIQLISQSEATNESWQRFKTNREREWGLFGHDMGIHPLNLSLGGWISKKVTTIAGRSGHGKCLGYGTKVLLHNGILAEVQNLKSGDLLMGLDGNPNKIVSTVVGTDVMYKIKQNKGDDYVVNSVHVLSLYNAANKKRINIPLNEYLKRSNKFKTTHKGYKEEVLFNNELKSIIDPYFLGVWLGDGSSENISIFNVDKPILDWVANYSKSFDDIKLYSRKDPRNTVMELRLSNKNRSNHQTKIFKEFKRLNLFGNKHIPHAFLTATKEVRLKLLAGLIDTDGSRTTDKAGWEITQKRKVLIDGIKFLCDSLGFRTKITPKPVKGTMYYRLTIYGNTLNEVPVILPRKKSISGIRVVNKKITGITVENIGIGNYYGFSLENEDRRFYLSDCTITHNTALVTPMFDAGARVLNGRRAEFLFFSWEMGASFIVDRHICYKSGLTLRMLNQGAKLLDGSALERIRAFYGEARKLPVTYQQMSLNIEALKAIGYEFVAECNRKAEIEGVQIQPVIVVDYIGMAQFEAAGLRTYGIADFMNNLKQFCNTTGAAGLVFAQINRSADDKAVPDKSDLSDSQAIEMASDSLVIIHRPEYNGDKVLWDPKEEKEIPSDNKMLVRVVKGRDYGIGDFVVESDMKYFRVHDLHHKYDFKYWELYQDKAFWMEHFGFTKALSPEQVKVPF